MGPFDVLGLISGGSGAGGGVEPDDPAAPTDLGPGEFRRRADEAAERWPDRDLDFTLASLERLDDLAAERDGVFEDPLDPDDGLPAMAGGEYVLEFGSYCGEVLANNFDGDWVDQAGAGGSAADSRWVVELPVDEGAVTVGAFDVAARSFLDDPLFGEVADTLAAGEAGVMGEPGLGAAAERELDARAAAFVDAAGADLGYGPQSLLVLDDLAGGYEEVPDGLGAYLGTVVVRSYAGEWVWSRGLGWVVAVGGATLPVRTVLQDRLAGATTFAAAHDDLLARAGVEGPSLRLIATADRYEGAAAALAAERAALDYSVPSLATLDEAAARADGVDERRDLLDGGADDGPDAVARYGGYLAEVLRRTHDAEWRMDGGDPVLSVAGSGGTASLFPTEVARAVLDGEATFVDVYARLATRVDLDAPVDG